MVSRILIILIVAMSIAALYYFSQVKEGVRGKRATTQHKSVSGRNASTFDRMKTKIMSVMPTQLSGIFK